MDGSEVPRLQKPWLIAVWPGMGQVAITAGYYLMAKLDMEMFAEFSPVELFDVDQVVVQNGVIQPVERPHSRLYLWRDPDEQHDLLVFLGDAQPQLGKYAFCRKLIEFARAHDVERVFTFAAMATQMHPDNMSKVFGATTEQETVAEFTQMGIEPIEDGQIGGLNGILMGAALEKGIPGTCLLGEMPHIFVQFLYPKASLAVLRTFTTLAGIDLDTKELVQQAQTVDQHLGQILSQAEQAIRERQAGEGEEEEEFVAPPESTEEEITPEDEARIDDLFSKAAEDRSHAYELKQELDRLGVFKQYEDRFLDLFKKS